MVKGCDTGAIRGATRSICARNRSIGARIGATFMDPQKLINDFIIIKSFQSIIEVELTDLGGLEALRMRVPS